MVCVGGDWWASSPSSLSSSSCPGPLSNAVSGATVVAFSFSLLDLTSASLRSEDHNLQFKWSSLSNAVSFIWYYSLFLNCYVYTVHNLPSRRAAQTNWTIILGVETLPLKLFFFFYHLQRSIVRFVLQTGIYSLWNWVKNFELLNLLYYLVILHTYIIIWGKTGRFWPPYSFAAFTSLILGLSTANLYVIIYVIFFATKTSVPEWSKIVSEIGLTFSILISWNIYLSSSHLPSFCWLT